MRRSKQLRQQKVGMKTGKPFNCRVTMEREPSMPLLDEQLIQLACALGKIRDSWVMISLALKDVVTEIPAPARDEVLTEVHRYLCRLREANRSGFD